MIQGIKETLKQLLVNGGELQKRFSDVITKWKKQSKFKYVSLVESDYPLNGIDDRYCCSLVRACTGMQLYFSYNFDCLSDKNVNSPATRGSDMYIFTVVHLSFNMTHSVFPQPFRY